MDSAALRVRGVGGGGAIGNPHPNLAGLVRGGDRRHRPFIPGAARIRPDGGGGIPRRGQLRCHAWVQRRQAGGLHRRVWCEFRGEVDVRLIEWMPAVQRQQVECGAVI